MHVTLPDGRNLGYAEYGDRAGKPVLYFSGTPGSRLLHPPEGPTQALGVRLIIVERPGFGLSDFQPGRTLLHWPADVVAFADALGIHRFAVVGVSAGGPYALACAYRIPKRITKAAFVCGVGPTDIPGATRELPLIRRVGAAVARRAPWALSAVLWLVANPRRDSGRFFERMISGNSEVDREILSHPEMRDTLVESYREATRTGIRGFARDAIILSSPWGFRIEEISIPISVWHGEEDANVSILAARQVARAIRDCRATFISGEGHWLFLRHWEEILRSVIA